MLGSSTMSYVMVESHKTHKQVTFHPDQEKKWQLSTFPCIVMCLEKSKTEKKIKKNGINEIQYNK